MTRAPAWPAALLAVTFLFVPLQASADPYKDMAKQLGKMGAKHLTEKKLAILPFDYVDKRSSPGGWTVAERLIGRFVERGDYTVVERSLVEKVLGELKFQGTGVIDPETAQKIGRGLGVPAVVTGTLESLPDGKVRINARMIEVETLKIVGAVEREVEQTWSDQPAAKPAPVGATTPSYDEVATAFNEHLRSGRYDKAYSMLTEKARIHISPHDFATSESGLPTIYFPRGFDIVSFDPPVSHESGDFVRVGYRAKGSTEWLRMWFWLHSEAGEWRVAYTLCLAIDAHGARLSHEFVKSSTLFSKVCEIVPVDPQAWADLSDSYSVLAVGAKDKEYGETAVKYGREAVRLGKTSSHAWSALGLALGRSGLYAKAEEALSTALSMNLKVEGVKVSGVFLARADIRRRQGKFNEALADVRKARAIDPNDADLKKLEQELLGELGKKRRAR